MGNIFVAIGFIVIWVVTFPIAWKMLARLIAQSSAGNSFRTWSFWINFLLYRLVIIAPYLWVLVFGDKVPGIIQKTIIGWVILGIALSLLRFLGAKKVTAFLWYIYGYVYDGLKNFYPYKNLLELVYKRIEPKKGMEILDLGCGTGNFSEIILSRTDAKITAVDSASSMLKKTRKKIGEKYHSRVNIRSMDVLEYLDECPNETFDYVVLINVVYAVSDRQKLWHESLRVLKPGGKIIMTNSDKPGSMSIIREHLANSSWFKLVNPYLLAVGIIDYFISEFSKTDVFEFVSFEKINSEIKNEGGRADDVVRCYGGAEFGVNILTTISKLR